MKATIITLMGKNNGNMIPWNKPNMVLNPGISWIMHNQLQIDILRGERKVEDWANSIGVSTVNIDYKEPDPFFNINTKEDLEKAIKEIQND